MSHGYTVPNSQNRPPPQPSHGFVTTPRIFFRFLPKVEELTRIRYSFQLIWSEFYNSKFLRKRPPKSGIHMPQALPHAIYSICSPLDCQQMYILLLYATTEAIVHIWMIDLLRVSIMLRFIMIPAPILRWEQYFLTAYSACLASSPFLINTIQWVKWI